MPKKSNAASAATQSVNETVEKKQILKNVLGEDMNPADYFFPFPKDDDKGHKAGDVIIPPYFNASCGYPVDREDLLEVFNKIFKPEDGLLFYKTRDKEVYVIIVPIKLGSTISKDNDSFPGDFQKHSISFIAEGSANPESLRLKLNVVAKSLGYTNK